MVNNYLLSTCIQSGAVKIDKTESRERKRERD